MANFADSGIHVPEGHKNPCPSGRGVCQELHELGAGGISEMKASREFNHPVLQIMYKLDLPQDCEYVTEELPKAIRAEAQSYLDHKLTINPKDR